VLCEGYLFPEHRDRWRCWTSVQGQRMQHGRLNATAAIKHSCNIFMYQAGEKLGVTQLSSWFDMVGFGRGPGTGLIEEAPGINPTPAWLEKRGMHANTGRARHYAIGQAEVSITPLQAANLMAVYASGEYRPVCLVREMGDERAWILPGSPGHWLAIRRGLYGVVNDPDGTARRTAYLDPASGYALCGKTGSAEARSWPTAYQVPYEDPEGRRGVAVIPAGDRKTAIADFIRQYPNLAFDFREVEVASRWPDQEVEQGRKHSHAWFAGYLQPLDASGAPDWQRLAPIAFAVIVEFGGSGGRTSGPIALQVASITREILGSDLDPDRVPDGRRRPAAERAAGAHPERPAEGGRG
jgi:cell division protein FtsI/penicillin-binding protein 2